MIIILSIIFIIIDQVSKLIVINTLSKTKSVEVIKSFFYLTYTNNNGAAFSILTGKRVILIIVTLIVIGILIYYIRKTKVKENINKIALSLVIGGSIGNLIDRIVRGAVVDFLDFKIFGYNYPIFNLADTFIVLGVFLLLISMFRKDKIMIVDINNIGKRIDKYLCDNTEYTRSKIQKMIETGNILVNGNKVKDSYKVKENDNIEITELIEETDILPENIPLDIYYEDDDLIVVNKPSGMVVHPAPGNRAGTLVNALLYHTKNLSTINTLIRPGIVHRIDADTSGLLLVAKNDRAHNILADAIAKKEVVREYIALVEGIIKEDTATIDAPIGRDVNNRKKMCVTSENSKEAITHFRVIERLNNATLIRCKLETGRTHQIRVHLNYIGHPIVNDPVYGKKKLIDEKFGQMLHAEKIGFVHPTTKEYMEFTAPVPDRFKEILEGFR